MKFFLRISIIVFLFLSYSSCISKEIKIESISQYASWEGWNGNPEGYKIKPYDYFYYLGYARNPYKRIEKLKNPSLSCSNAALQQLKGNLVRTMIGSSTVDSMQFKNEEEIENILSILVGNYTKKEIYLKECRAIAYPYHSEFPHSIWIECECLVYLYVPGGKDTIIKEAIELHKLNQKDNPN